MPSGGLDPNPLRCEADVPVRESLLGPPGRKAAPVVFHDQHELAVPLREADVDEARVRVPHDVREQLARGREDELVVCVGAGAVEVETESEASSGGCLLGDRAQRRFEPRRLEDVRMEVEDGLAQLPDGLGQRRVRPGQGGVCLLYTSPSPRDLSTSRMPSSA